MNIYFSIPQDTLTDSMGNPLQHIPELAYGDVLAVTFTALDANNAPVDLAAATQWKLVIDVDRTNKTKPVYEIYSEHIVYDPATKTLTYPVDTKTLEFFSAVDGRNQTAMTVELTGHDAADTRLFRFAWGIIGLMPVSGAEPPDPITRWVDRAYVDSRIVRGYQVQFSSTPDVEASWVAEQGSHTHYRWRLRDGVAWSDPIALITGRAFQYSDFTPAQLAALTGPSAYQSWLANGHTGTEADFTASITAPRYQAFGLPVCSLTGVGEIHCLDAIYTELTLANNVRNASAVWLYLRSASTVSGNIVLIPSVNGVDLPAQVIAVPIADVRRRISFPAPVTGKIKFRRDTANAADTLKDPNVVTAYAGTDIEVEVIQ